MSGKKNAWLRMLGVISVAAALSAPNTFAATMYLDLNGSSPGFGGPSGNADLTTAGKWTTDTTGSTAPGIFNAAKVIQIGITPTDFSGGAITLTMSLNGDLTGSDATSGITIVSNSVTVTLAGTTNTRFNHPFQWNVASGSKLTVTDTAMNNGFNFNSQNATMAGGGIMDFMSAFGSNEGANSTLTENMPGGTILLDQTKTSNFGGAGLSNGFALSAGTLAFSSALSLANTFQAFSATAKFAINGGILDNVTGSAGTVALGAGSYSIGGNFTFAGTNALNLGTAAVALNGDRTITVANSTLTVGGTISGTGSSLTKAGAGTLALSSVPAYTGATTVSGGVLDVSQIGGGWTLSGSQSLVNNGVVAGSVTAPAGTAISGQGGVFQSDLTVGGVYAIHINGATADSLTVQGTANFSGDGSLSIAQLAGPTAGSYTVLTAGALMGLSAGPIATVGRTTYSVDGTALNSNKLVIDVGIGTANVTWNNAGGTGDGTTWLSTGAGSPAPASQNWNNGGSADCFYDGDMVTFNDSSNGNYTVTVSGTVLPGSVTFSNSSGDYTVGGGTIGGSAGVTVNGSGAVTLTAANSYSGGTTVSGGTLVVGHSEALGTGGLTIHTGGKVQLQAGLAQAVVLPSVSFDGSTGAWTGELDLTNDKMVVNSTVSKATALANLQNQAHSVLTSSTMAANYGIAVLDNSVLNKATYGGVSVNSNAILVGAELLGDTNADGRVDQTDLNTVLNNLGAATAAWTSGNFTGAATVNLTDLAYVINNFGMSNPNASNQPGGLGSSEAAPEPASLAVVGLGAVALMGRRRKA